MPNVAAPWPNDPPWLKRAFSDLGLREIKGARHNPRILEMFEKAGHPEISNDETAWCAAACNCWLVEGGQPGTGSLMARSFLKYGRKLDTSKPLPRGAILIWPRGKPPSGHTNLLLEDDGETVTCIGGNQRPAPGAVSISHDHKDNLLGAVWPSGYPLPGEDVPLPPERPPRPAPIEPVPQDEEPEADERYTRDTYTKPPGFLRRQWQRFKRLFGIGATGTGGATFLAWLTEPWAVAAMIAGGIVFVILLYLAALHLFGKERVRNALSQLWKKVVPP